MRCRWKLRRPRAWNKDWKRCVWLTKIPKRNSWRAGGGRTASILSWRRKLMWEQVGQTLNDSTVRVVSQIASLLPGMLALVFAVLLAALLAWMVAMVLRRSLRGIHFDEQLRTWGFTDISDWSPEQSPTVLITRVISWSIVLLGFVLGLAAFDA